MLGTIRRSGFSATVHQLGLDDEVSVDLLVEPASRAARVRRDRALAGLGHSAYLTTELEATRRYAISMIAAPIFDHHERAEALILLTGFPRELDTVQVQAVGEQLNAAARRVTTAVGGSWPSSPATAGKR